MLETWVRSKGSGNFILLKTYQVAAMSGQPGPKRQEGDRQVPEGFYRISGFNPTSRFHLSMRVNYPNQSDNFRSDPSRPGTDIFIHGSNVSIGCIAMTDPWIEEIYTLCKTQTKPIQVHIFPFRLTTSNIDQFSEKHPAHRFFWEELKPGYDFFESNKRLPAIGISKLGAYKCFAGAP